MTTRTESEADEILKRLRASGDPIRVLQSVQQAYLLLPNPTSASQLAAYPQLDKLDSEAYRLSAFKLRARPWTAVADDGIVSALVSTYFAWDGYYFLPFLNPALFIRDMSNGDIKRAKYCSPFLVNAICALQVGLFYEHLLTLSTSIVPAVYI